MFQTLYDWIISHTTRRQWTHILRDQYHDAPLEFLVVWSLLVSLLANLVTAQWELAVWASIAIGALLGHLFWGTPWRRGQ